MDFTWQQNHALNILLRCEKADFATLRPVDIPANQFAYHLKQLVSQKLIFSQGDGSYSLTDSGQRLAGEFSTLTNSQTKSPKTVVALFAKNSAGEYLLFRWSRQPYLSVVGPVYNRLSQGKTLSEELRNVCNEKLGVNMVAKDFMTSAMVRVFHGDALISHMNMLFYSVDAAKIDSFTGRNGRAFFASVNNTDSYFSGLSELFLHVENQQPPADFILRY